MALPDLPVHVVIPDTQVKPGVPTDHVGWIGQYVVDHFGGHPNLTVIHLGDHWDMPSLSSYDKGKRAMEGRRYLDDIEAGNEAFARLDAPIHAQRKWNPRKILLRGNHENRIERAAEDTAQLEGVVSIDHCDALDWEVHPFLEVLSLHGVAYSHYFYNPMNGRPYSGMIETRIKNVGRSFTQGHQQTLMYGVRPAWAPSGHRGMQHGLVAGACYLHDEDYIGPQGNAEWRGIVVKYEVEDGSYCPMFVSLDYLCRRYEGRRLAQFLGRRAV